MGTRDPLEALTAIAETLTDVGASVQIDGSGHPWVKVRSGESGMVEIHASYPLDTVVFAEEDIPRKLFTPGDVFLITAWPDEHSEITFEAMATRDRIPAIVRDILAAYERTHQSG